ncbi:MAG: hypothetical protein E7214_06665 [Clostridium sp.]|nr:hypothetical protein [Clostridium sp.]
MEDKIKRASYVVSSFLVGYFIYIISILFLKIGLDTASGEMFVVTLSLYLCFSLVKYLRAKGDIIQNNIEDNFKISNWNKKLKDISDVMEGLDLKINNEEVHIENLIITSSGVFNIVKCNYTGDIKVEKGNRWYQLYKMNRSELMSPITELRENRKILANLFKEDEIIDVIVMVKDRVYVEGKENSDVAIIRYDELYSFLNEYSSEESLDKEELYNKIYPRLIKLNDIAEENKIYNQFINDRWIFRSRLTFISVFFILYMLNLIYK